MEEKEQIKVKLSTVLVIIAIIAIIAIGLIIGVLYNQNVKQNISTNNPENAMIGEKTVSESEIKDLFQNFMNLFGKYQGSPYSVLYEMKKTTGKNVINDEYPKEIQYNGEYVLPTNIKYSEFKEFMLNYMTEEFFNTDFSNGYVNKDGDLYCKNFGATGVDYEVKSIEKQENSEVKYKAKVNMVYSDEDKEEVDILFEINNSEKCVISSITMPSENMKNNDEDNTKNTNSKDSTSEKEAQLSNSNSIKNKEAQISNSNLIGKWEPAFAKKDNKDISLMDIYGSSIKLGGTMEFKNNNKYTAFIGAYSSEMEDDLQGGYINGETSVTLIANSGKKKILVVKEIDGKIYLQEEKHDNGSIIMVYFKKMENTTNTSTTASSNIENKDTYKEITKKLEGDDVLEVTNSINNDDGTYTLKGKISVVDTAKKQIAEYPFRKYNGEYMQITIPKDTKCVYSIDSYEEKTSTVEEVFSRKLAFGNCFNFEFENGKCVSVYEVVVGH